jgi:hypothetical protein
VSVIRDDLDRITADVRKKNRVLALDEARTVMAYGNFLKSMVARTKPAKRTVADVLERIKDYPEILDLLRETDPNQVDDRKKLTHAESDEP